MPALVPIILTASQIVLAADSVPKFDVERTCRPSAAAGVPGLPGRHSTEWQRNEENERSNLQEVQERDGWSRTLIRNPG